MIQTPSSGMLILTTNFFHVGKCRKILIFSVLQFEISGVYLFLKTLQNSTAAQDHGIAYNMDFEQWAYENCCLFGLCIFLQVIINA